jgi:hypothetical protein
MRTITRKTNVRRHARNCKTPTTVRQHNRNVTRQVLGTVRVKDLTYKQSKKIFPRLPANQDWDGDGVKNKKDCRPFDVERQHDEIDDLERDRKKVVERIEFWKKQKEKGSDYENHYTDIMIQGWEDELKNLDEKEKQMSIGKLGGIIEPETIPPIRKNKHAGMQFHQDYERKKRNVPFNYEGFEDTNDTTERYWGN